MNKMSYNKNRRVLVIDDIHSIHDDFRKILSPLKSTRSGQAELLQSLFGDSAAPFESPQFEVDSAYQGQDGAILVKKAISEGRPYAMAFVDVRMPPGWDGVETTRKLWEIDPDLQIVLCTAYADYSWGDLFEQVGRHDGLLILKKPFDTVEAIQLACALTEKWWLHRESRRKAEELESGFFERTHELRQAEQKLAHAMSLAQLVDWEYNVAGGFFTFSDRYYALHGTTSELEGGQTVSAEAFARKFVHPDDAHLVAEELAKAVATADPDYTSQREVRILRRNGEVRNVLVHISITKDAAGRTLQLRGANQDITERKKSEHELRKLSCAVKQSPASIVITDLRGDIEYVNPKFCAVTGYSLEEVLKENPRVLKSGEMTEDGYRELWATITSGKEWHGEFHNRKKNGELYWESASISPIFDDKGNVSHFIAVKEDITARKLAEQSLRESEEKFRQLADNITDVFWITSPDRKTIHYASPGYERIWGHSTASLSANPRQWSEAIPPEERAAVLAVFAQLMGDQSQVSVEYRIVRPDGAVRWIHDRGFQVRDAAGKLVRLTGIASDITERKRVAEELAEHKEKEERAQRALLHERELNRMKGHFVSMVSHEFRTPLCIINSAASLLENFSAQMTEQERAEQAQEIEHAVERMTQMMEDFLMHEKLQSGKMECKAARVNLEAFCREVIAEVSRPVGNACLIEFAFDPAASEAWLDERILRHILCNLLSNAVKYSDKKQPVLLEVKQVGGPRQSNGHPKVPPGEHIQLLVRDTGIGIPAADLGKLYQTFHRAANVGNRPGTGMGLAIVKKFVDLHQGMIHLQSIEGKGTSVWVLLPAAPREVPKRSSSIESEQAELGATITRELEPSDIAKQ